MSSPAKKPNIADAVNKLAELKAADNKLLILGALCISGKMDYEKLARLTGLKRTSASSNYNRAKKRLVELVGEEFLADAADAADSPNAASSADTTAGFKHPSPEESPRKSPIKRRKTMRQIIPSDADDDEEDMSFKRQKYNDAERTAIKSEDSD